MPLKKISSPKAAIPPMTAIAMAKSTGEVKFKRNFVNWAEEQKIPNVQVIHLAKPHDDVVAQRPELRGKSGTGDSHMMPVFNNDAIDFTARQFNQPNQFNSPLVTPLSSIKQVYNKIGGEYSSSQVSQSYKDAVTKEISQSNMTVYMKSNQIFQIRYPNKDIKIRVKTLGGGTF